MYPFIALAIAVFIVAAILLSLDFLKGLVLDLQRKTSKYRHAGARKIPGRHLVTDISLLYNMISGFAGDINRSHPFSEEPNLLDPTNPPTAWGQAVIGNTASGGVRAFLSGDTGTKITGVLSRPYPIQQTTGGMAATIGAASVSGNPVGVLRKGYVLVPVVGTPVKFGPVYIWIAATGGGHTLGGFEAAAGGSGGASTGLLANAEWSSGPDANGIAEVNLGL